MRVRRTATVLAVVAIFCTALAHTATAQDLIIVATKATFQDAQGWVDFLKMKEIPLKHITPQEFTKGKKEKYIVLMGGMDEPDGIRDIAKGVLTKGEFQSVTQEGNGSMYKKSVLPKEKIQASKLWETAQNFIIFAGADRTAATAARKNSKEEWWEEICVWFDIDESPAIPAY